MTEEWKAIPGYPGYMASTLGNVCSRLGRLVGSSTFDKSNKYVSVTIFIKGERFVYGAHRLIALTFLGPAPPGKYMIDHINRDKTDNRICNLRWVNASENQLNKIGFGISCYKGLALKEGTGNRKDRWECRITILDKRHYASFPLDQKQNAINWLRDKRLELKLPE